MSEPRVKILDTGSYGFVLPVKDLEWQPGSAFGGNPEEVEAGMILQTEDGYHLVGTINECTGNCGCCSIRSEEIIRWSRLFRVEGFEHRER